MSIIIHSPNTLVRGGITDAMVKAAEGHQVLVRVGAVTDGVRGTRIQGRTKPPEQVIGRVFALVELSPGQVEQYEKEYQSQQ